MMEIYEWAMETIPAAHLHRSVTLRNKEAPFSQGFTGHFIDALFNAGKTEFAKWEN
ncbi:MAG: hypothetical protein KBB83_02735 [Alphaproteobacteria bacterium]|nr:hypothetical protein [Alphaproteobacteria bacterium]